MSGKEWVISTKHPSRSAPYGQILCLAVYKAYETITVRLSRAPGRLCSPFPMHRDGIEPPALCVCKA